MGDPGINFCDEYYSVMGFSASQRKDLLMELRAQTGEMLISLYEPEDLHLNNE